MSKFINTAIVDGLAKELAPFDSCVVLGVRDLSVADVYALRKSLREKKFQLRVVKNTLASVAFDKANMRGLGKVLKGPSAVVYGGEGAGAISKVLVEEVKKRKDQKLVIYGAFSEGEVLDAAGVDALAKAPGRQELLSMVLAGFTGPVTEMSRLMEGLLSETHGLITALCEKREQEGGAG